MSMDQAVASNWVLEKFSPSSDGFNLTGTTKGYASFSRAFADGTTVFYAASDDDGNREAGYGTYQNRKITDITVTATLFNGVYNDNNPSRINFKNGGTIAGTFNAVAFNTMWNRKDGAGMVISPTEPVDPVTGTQWLDSTTARVWIWDGDKWIEFPAGGGVGANVAIEEFPPTAHKVGDMWTDYGTTGELYVWDGRFWVSMTGDGGPKVILGGEEGGAIDLPENITLDNLEDPDHADKALARHISSSGVGKWLPINTGDVETDPGVTFRDAKGRFKSTDDYTGLTDQLKVNRFIANELDALNQAVDTIGEKGYDDTALTKRIEKEELARQLADAGLKESLLKDINELEEKLSDKSLTDEEKARRLKAPLQYRGYLEMDADGKPIAPWDEVFLDENEFGVDREVGGWFGHSTAGFQYGRWDMRDCDWIWLVSDNLAEAYENNDYQAIDTAWKVTPKNVGDTFALEMLNLALDTWEDDQGFYFFKGTQQLEFRVEEIYWPEHPKGWTNSYAPMVRVSQVRNRDFYRYYLPEKPEYNFDGEKAVSAHLTNLIITNNDLYATKDDLSEAIENIDFPEGADLSGYATKEQLDALADDSAATDNSLFKAIEEESTKTNVAVTALQIELNNVDKKSQEKDRDLQKQIDELDIPDAVDLTGYATEEWVTEQIEGIDFPDTDLTPVEERLDDIEAVLPKAPLVIPPVDVGPQTLKITGSRPTGSGGEAGSVLMWKTLPGGPGSPYNECKFVVPDTSVIDREVASIWWKQGDKVQRWDMNGAGWFTNGNVLHYSAQETSGDTLVDGQPVELYYLDPNTAGDDLIDAISRLESKADDRKLQAEIEVLSGQLSTLVKSQEDGEWTYKGELPERPRNAGEFTLATATLTSENNSLFVFETDLGGITHNFTAPVGSYIEIVDIDDPLDYVLFEVTREPDGTGLIQIDVKMIKAGNSFDLDDRCIIRFFEVAEGLDVNELDRRYLKLAGGTMKGDLNLSGTGASIGWTDDQGQNWIQFKFGTTSEYKGWYSTDDAIATKKRVQEQIDAALAGSGSKSITGTQMMMGAYTYWDMPAGRFTLIQGNQTSPTINPNNAYGIRFYPAQEWFEDTHEFISGGYISLQDPFTGKVQFAGKVDRVEKDNSAANRWSFFIPFAYKWGDNLNPDGQFLITLSGCLREK